MALRQAESVKKFFGESFLDKEAICKLINAVIRFLKTCYSSINTAMLQKAGLIALILTRRPCIG